MNKEININIDIPIINIINKTNEETSHDLGMLTPCAYNNILLYNFFELLAKETYSQMSSMERKGGKKNKTRKVNKKSNRKPNKKQNPKKHRTRRNKKAGSKIITTSVMLFALVFLFMTQHAESVLNVTYDSVIEDLYNAFSVSDIFRNKYNTCAPNTMLFLKTIGLNTFETLSAQVMKEKRRGLKESLIVENLNLNKKVNVNELWDIIPVQYETTKVSLPPILQKRMPNYKSDKLMDKYILSIHLVEEIKRHMIKLREKLYPLQKKQSIVTMGGLPIIGHGHHAVTFWLTHEDKLILIDPQKFYYTDYVLIYGEEPPTPNQQLPPTTSTTSTQIYNNNNNNNPNNIKIKTWSLVDYFVDNLEYMKGNNYFLMSELHTQIDDQYDKDKLTPDNPRVIEVISNLRELESQMKDENEREL